MVGVHVEHNGLNEKGDGLVGRAVGVGVDDVAKIPGDNGAVAVAAWRIGQPRHGKDCGVAVHRCSLAHVGEAGVHAVDQLGNWRPSLGNRHHDLVGCQLPNHRLGDGVGGTDDRG